MFGAAVANRRQVLQDNRDLLTVRRAERIELQWVLAHGEFFPMSRASDRPIDVGEGAAAGLLPGTDPGWCVFGCAGHRGFSKAKVTRPGNNQTGTAHAWF